MISRSMLLLATGVTALFATPALAADEASPVVGDMAAAAVAGDPVDPADREWEFAITPYLWAAGTSGDAQLADGEGVDIDTSFGDILSDLKFAAMVGMEARRDRFVLLGDIIYISLGSEAEGPLGFVDAKIDPKVFIGTFLGGYRVVDEGPLFFDIVAGARVSSLDVSIELEGPLNNVIERDASKTAVGPVVGARFRAPLSQDWGIAVYGDVGGFGVSADLTWQLMGTIQYDISRHWRFAAGYRHVSVKTDKKFDFDFALSGPIVGFSYRF